MSEVWYSEPGWWLALILGIIGSGIKGRTVVSITECETDPPEEVIDDVEHGYYLLAPLPTSDSIGLPHCLLKPLQSISLSVLVKGSKGQIIPSGKLFQGNITKFDLYGQPTTITVLPKITRPLVTLLLVAIASGLVWLTTILQAPFKTIISAIVAIPVLTLLLFGLIVLVAQPMICVKNTLQGKTKIKWR